MPQSPTHPGFGWLDLAACTNPDTSTGGDPAAPFFVDAGKVIDSATLRMCQEICPVRRECLTHAYIGGPGGTPIGAGYFAGFSVGERRKMTLAEGLAKIDTAEKTRGV